MIPARTLGALVLLSMQRAETSQPIAMERRMSIWLEVMTALARRLLIQWRFIRSHAGLRRPQQQRLRHLLQGAAQRQPQR